jgi:sugar/nucleoside kinase (ribokinase family)
MKCLKVDDLLLSLHEAAVWRGSDVAEGSTGTGHQRAGAGGDGCTGAVQASLAADESHLWVGNESFYQYIYIYIYAYNITHRHRVLPRPTTMMLYDFR